MPGEYNDIYSGTDNSNRDEFYSWRKMHDEKNAEDLLRSHQAVTEYWREYNDRRESMYDYVKGQQWTDDELQLMRNKRKAPVVFNKIIGSVRSICGHFIQDKYDMKPAPTEPTDQGIADILVHRHNWHSHNTRVAMKDPEMIKEAVTGGNAWQESWVEVTPGGKPRIMVTNQNNHAIYPDPNSRDLIDRSDCQFIDRASWLTNGELMERWPEHSTVLASDLESYENDTDGSYEPEKKYANRTHETQYERNGRFLVIERFYKVWKKRYYGLTEAYDKMDIGFDDDGSKRSKWKEMYPDYDIHQHSEEFLFLAVSVPVFRLTTFLSNEPYHNQPRDPVTERIMFPFVELICESLDGETNGFVEYMVGPQRLINSMMANKLHAAKHSVNTSLIGDPSKFTEDGREDLETNHSDGDRVFWTKKGENPAGALQGLPQTSTNQDTDQVLEYSDRSFNELASTPPAMKGQSEGSTSGVLNEQRIQQAFLQLLGFIKNYKHFLEKRSRLWAYYDREYFTDEETFRILEKKNPDEPDFVTINKSEEDMWGNITKSNDINAAVYDIVYEDSYQSPTQREKVRKQVVEILQTPGAQNDPILSTMLTMYHLRLGDAPQDLKDFVYRHSQVMKQMQAEQQQTDAQGTQIEQAQQMNDLAQTRAEQEFSPGAGGQPQPPSNQNPIEQMFNV